MVKNSSLCNELLNSRGFDAAGIFGGIRLGCPLLEPALLGGLRPIRPKLISKKVLGPLAEPFRIPCKERGAVFEGCCVSAQP